MNPDFLNFFILSNNNPLLFSDLQPWEDDVCCPNQTSTNICGHRTGWRQSCHANSSQ